MALPAFTSLFPDFHTIEVLIHLEGALATVQDAMSYYANHVVASIEPLVKTSLALFVVLYGFALMRGVIREPVNETATRVFKIAIVASLSLNFARYNDIIGQFFWNLPEYLVVWLTPSDLLTDISLLLAPTTTSGVDISILLITTLMSAVVSIMDGQLLAASVGGQTDPTAFASGLGIGVAGASISAVAAGILLVTKISLSVLLALGPFFLISILFEKTKHWFDGWLSQVVNYVLVVLLLTLTIYILFPILIIVVSSYYLIAKLAGALTLVESVELMVLLGIFLAVLRQVPTTAAALVRGYAINGPQEKSMMGSNYSGGQSVGKSAGQVQAEQSHNR